jgi:hypothetical protein
MSQDQDRIEEEEVHRLLDEATEQLCVEPVPGDRADVVAMRHARAQHALLVAHLLILRKLAGEVPHGE